MDAPASNYSALYVSATESNLEGVRMMASVDVSIIIGFVKSKLIKMTRA